jgi:phage shock protein E
MGLFSFLGIGGGNITAVEAKALVGRGALLLDVRSKSEFSSGHLSGAKNIPVQELGARLGELPPKATTIVVYCHSGARSAAAASKLKKVGFDAHDLGAMSNWRR